VTTPFDQIPSDKKTEMTYWDAGWIRTSKDPANPKVRFDYFAQGWQRTRTLDGHPNLGMSWDYFPDGLMKERHDRDGGFVSYEYDSNGNLLKAFDQSGVSDDRESPFDIGATYDWLDRPVEVRDKKLSEPGYRTTKYDYDLNGNVEVREDQGRRHTFTYDQADWLRTQIDEGTDAATCSDDRRIVNDWGATGWESERTIRRGCEPSPALRQNTRWEWFSNGLLKTLTTKNQNGVVLESHDVSYETDSGIYMNGHRIKDTFTLDKPGTPVGPDGTDPCPTGCTARWEYDPRDRLRVHENGKGTRTVYDLDPAGNVVKETVTGGLDPGTRDLTYAGNQLQTVTDDGTTTKYWYDALGRLDCITTLAGSADICRASDSTSPPAALVADYNYDPLDRLTSYRAFLGGSIQDRAAYTYDALDRVSSEEENHPGTQNDRTTSFAYQGLTSLVTKETATGTDAGVKSYSYDVYGNRLSLMDTPSGQQTKDYLYAYDVHGSTSLLVQESGLQQGQVEAAYGYTPYGSEDPELTEGGPNEDVEEDDGLVRNPLNPYRYSARRLDSGSQSLDMGARRFSTGDLRFLQQDFLSSALDDLSLSLDPLTQNRFALAGGNPVSFVEWDGHRVAGDGEGAGAKNPAPLAGGDVGGRPAFTTLDPGDVVSLSVTFREFSEAPVEDRIRWFDWFQGEFNTEGWFNAQRGVLRGFRYAGLADWNWANESWSSVVDAAILHGIQGGMAIHEGRDPQGRNRASEAWAHFFGALQPSPEGARSATLPMLRDLWVEGEQVSTRVGTRRAGSMERIPTLGEWNVFEASEDYRSAVEEGILFDPRIESQTYQGTQLMYGLTIYPTVECPVSRCG
jgi:RHS repeat-associated protein